MILGPPAAGKSTVAKQLAAHYKVHHIKIKDVIDDEIQRLVRKRLFNSETLKLRVHYFLQKSP
jgi:adenylate kinase family enzyme